MIDAFREYELYSQIEIYVEKKNSNEGSEFNQISIDNSRNNRIGLVMDILKGNTSRNYWKYLVWVILNRLVCP